MCTTESGADPLLRANAPPLEQRTQSTTPAFLNSLVALFLYLFSTSCQVLEAICPRFNSVVLSHHALAIFLCIQISCSSSFIIIRRLRYKISHEYGRQSVMHDANLSIVRVDEVIHDRHESSIDCIHDSIFTIRHCSSTNSSPLVNSATKSPGTDDGDHGSRKCSSPR